jgi:hypothetical protein
MNRILSVLFAFAIVLVGCGGGGTNNNEVACPKGQHHSTQVTTSTLDCVDDIVPDTTPPNATITSPADGATVFGNVTLTATVTDSSGVKSAEFRLDDTLLQSIPIGTTAPTSTWITTNATEGLHQLTVYACDNAGNCGKAATSNVVVANQTVEALCSQKIKDDLGHLQKVTDCAITGVKENGHFLLFIKNGACWAEIVDDGPHFAINSRMAESLASSVQYTSTASGQTVTVPDIRETATCKWM